MPLATELVWAYRRGARPSSKSACPWRVCACLSPVYTTAGTCCAAMHEMSRGCLQALLYPAMGPLTLGDSALSIRHSSSDERCHEDNSSNPQPCLATGCPPVGHWSTSSQLASGRHPLSKSCHSKASSSLRNCPCKNMPYPGHPKSVLLDALRIDKHKLTELTPNLSSAIAWASAWNLLEYPNPCDSTHTSA